MTTSRRNQSAAAPRRPFYTHAFVGTLPDELRENVLYVSIQFATSAHKCFCGCGREVVTPIHPTKWKLTFDGVHVSLHPSVGSWSLPCQSHYWLQNGNVMWADKFSEEQIRAVRSRDLRDQTRYFEKKEEPAPPASEQPPPPSFWRTATRWLWGK